MKSRILRCKDDDFLAEMPIGVAGVIAGRSLYEGTLTLKQALAAAR